MFNFPKKWNVENGGKLDTDDEDELPEITSYTTTTDESSGRLNQVKYRILKLQQYIF